MMKIESTNVCLLVLFYILVEFLDILTFLLG